MDLRKHAMPPVEKVVSKSTRATHPANSIHSGIAYIYIFNFYSVKSLSRRVFSDTDTTTHVGIVCNPSARNATNMPQKVHFSIKLLKFLYKRRKRGHFNGQIIYSKNDFFFAAIQFMCEFALEHCLSSKAWPSIWPWPYMATRAPRHATTFKKYIYI